MLACMILSPPLEKRKLGRNIIGSESNPMFEADTHSVPAERLNRLRRMRHAPARIIEASLGRRDGNRAGRA